MKFSCTKCEPVQFLSLAYTIWAKNNDHEMKNCDMQIQALPHWPQLSHINLSSETCRSNQIYALPLFILRRIFLASTENLPPAVFPKFCWSCWRTLMWNQRLSGMSKLSDNLLFKPHRGIRTDIMCTTDHPLHHGSFTASLLDRAVHLVHLCG